MENVEFSSYTVYQPFGRVWSTDDLIDGMRNYNQPHPISGDALSIAREGFKHRMEDFTATPDALRRGQIVRKTYPVTGIVTMGRVVEVHGTESLIVDVVWTDESPYDLDRLHKYSNGTYRLGTFGPDIIYIEFSQKVQGK